MIDDYGLQIVCLLLFYVTDCSVYLCTAAKYIKALKIDMQCILCYDFLLYTILLYKGILSPRLQAKDIAQKVKL